MEAKIAQSDWPVPDYSTIYRHWTTSLEVLRTPYFSLSESKVHAPSQT